MTRISSILVVLLSITLAGCIGDSKDEATPLKFGSTQGNITLEVGQEFRYDILVTPESARDYEITVAGLPDGLTLETEKSLPVTAHSHPTTIEYLASDGEDIYFVGDNEDHRTVHAGRYVYKTRIGSTDNAKSIFAVKNTFPQKEYIGGMTIADRVLYIAVYAPPPFTSVTNFYKLDLANANPTAELIRQVPGKAISIVVSEGRLHWNDGSRVTRSVAINNPGVIKEESYSLSKSLGTLGIDAYGNIHMDDTDFSVLRTYVDSNPAYSTTEAGCVTGIAGSTGVGTYIASDTCSKNNTNDRGNLRFVSLDGNSTGGGNSRVLYDEGGIVFDKPVLAVTVTASGRVVWSIAERHGANAPSLYTFTVQKNALVGAPTEAGTYPITLTLPGGETQTFTITVTEPPVYYEVTGVAYGLQGSLQLSNNDTDTIRITNSDPEEASSFGFNTKLEEGDAFDVEIAADPAGQTCTLRDEEAASGVVGTANVELIVDCEFNTYAIGGTVTGLDGTLVLTLNEGETSSEEISVTQDTFSFTGEFDVGFAYNVGIKTQPDGQTCELNNIFLDEEGEATTPVVSGPVSLSISCEDVAVPERTLSVTVEGLPSGTVPVKAWGPEDARWAQESKAFSLGTGSFNNTMRDGETFDIGKIADPDGYNCSITAESPLSGDIDGLGTVNGNVTITFTCVASGGGGGEIPAPADPFPI